MKLSDFEKDALGEIGNIGASHAANSLSQLIRGKVVIQVPEVDSRPVGEILDVMGIWDNDVVGVYARLSEDISGAMVLLFPAGQARNLVNLLMDQEVEGGSAFTEMEVSAIKEGGNIMISSFANAMSDFLDLKIMLTPTEFTAAPLHSLLNIEGSEPKEEAIFFTTLFLASTREIVGYLAMLPDQGVYTKIFRAIKKRYGF